MLFLVAPLCNLVALVAPWPEPKHRIDEVLQLHPARHGFYGMPGAIVVRVVPGP